LEIYKDIIDETLMIEPVYKIDEAKINSGGYIYEPEFYNKKP